MATITTQMVTKFALRARKLNVLNGEQKESREAILEALKKGAVIPTDGPYVIDLSECGGKDFNWEDEYRKLRIKQYREQGYKKNEAEALTVAEMKSKKEDAPDKESEVIGEHSYIGGVRLLPKVNSKFSKKEAA